MLSSAGLGSLLLVLAIRDFSQLILFSVRRILLFYALFFTGVALHSIFYCNLPAFR